MKEFAPEVIEALTAAALSVALEPALLLAPASVETHGAPFEADGAPVILCKPANVYRELPAPLKAQALSTVRVAARLGVSRATLRRALAAFALAVATPAVAASPCHPSTFPPEWAAAFGDGVLLSTTSEGMTGLVSSWLAAHRAPALVADDYQLVASPDHVLVVPVRAGYVCPGGAMVSLPRDVAVDLFSLILSRSRSRA